MRDPTNSAPAVRRCIDRRRFIQGAAAGTLIGALGGCGLLGPDEASERARREHLADGRPRLPPGQRVIQGLREMGGSPGDPNPAAFRLRVYGRVASPLELDYAGLLRLPAVAQTCDVHCVTGWSALDTRWSGARIAELAERAKVLPETRYVIFEAAAGYTANVPLDTVLRPDSLVAYEFGGDPIAEPHGAPVRALVPNLYFWKSAKWLTGIRFAAADEPGYWEVRGYHNHGDPWREERFS
jgi:DMSO/TMAO reductase YedYZ molybdopterin-dependent catalytic subunit